MQSVLSKTSEENKEQSGVSFEYSAEQQRFLSEEISGDMCLIACPGAGKSTSILLKIDQMARFKQIKGKSACLILTFSKQQCEDLKLKIQKNRFEGISASSIMTIHSLCGKIYSSFTERSSSSKKTIVVAVNKLLVNQPDAVKVVPCLKSIRFIFVDEAQDLSEDQYKTIMLVSRQLRPEPVPVVMIGDSNQNIYQFQGSMNKFLLNHSNNMMKLSVNNRSTDEIVSFVREFQVHPAPMSGQGKSGPKPFVFQGQVEEIKVNLINYIRDLVSSGLQYEQIGVIGPSKMQKQYGKVAVNIGLQTVCNLLEESGIPYQQRYQLSDGNEDGCCSEAVKGHVNILTVHGSKGLEFEAVIIVDFKLKSMNKLPTFEQYENLKYLWFVALSRAKRHLRIFNIDKEQIWPEIHNINSNSFDSNKSLVAPKKQKFAADVPICRISVTKMLANNLMFSPANVFKFEQMLGFKVTQDQIYLQPTIDQPLDNTLSMLYGLFMENAIEMSFHLHKNSLNKYMAALGKRFHSYVSVHSENLKVFTEIDKKYNLNGEVHSEAILEEILQDCSFKQGKQTQVANFINLVREKKQKYLLADDSAFTDWKFKAVVISANIDLDPLKFQELLEALEQAGEDHQLLFNALFHITLYFFQIEYQAAYLLKRDFSQTIQALWVYFPLLHEYSKSLLDNASDVNFQVYLQHQDISITGVADVMTSDSLLEFKFTQEYSILHALQVYFYQLLEVSKGSAGPPKQMKVFNIRSGIMYTLTPDANVQLAKVLLELADITGLKLRNRVFVYDLETQGLDKYAHQIVQRHVVDYGTRSVVSSGFLNFPLSEEIKNLTHITDEQLASGDQDYSKMKAEFNQISRCCQDPVLIAHNGSSFDHPFLQSKGVISHYDFSLSDSRVVIAQHYQKKGNLQTTLSQLYNLICGPPQDESEAHNAVYDVKMILDIFDALQIKTRDLLVEKW